MLKFKHSAGAVLPATSRTTKSAIAALAICLSFANAQALQISIAKPGEGSRILDVDNYSVQLTGPIEKGDAKRLEAALKPLLADGRIFSFYLHSPGGNLMEGMHLGRIIRKYGLITYVGRYAREGETPLGGSCFSACSLSFLGGAYRFINSGSTYGVHRFYTDRAASSKDMDDAQIVSAAVSNYIREMGVDPSLFDSMTAAGRDEMNVLSARRLTELNVTNGGRLPPKWTIEVVKGSTYLRGEQTTIWGRGRAMFVCGSEGLVMQSIVPTSGEKAESIVQGKWFHSVLIDGNAVPIATPPTLRGDDGTLVSIIELTRAQVLSMAKAESLGQAIQVTRDDFRYVGYKIDIAKSDQERVGTYLMNCVAGK